MGNFRTEDDFTPHGGENFSDYGGYDNPEIGNEPGHYGQIKKSNIFSRILKSIGNIGTQTGSRRGKGVTLEKVLFLLYLIAMVVIVINIQAVLDFLFYATMPILQYVIILLILFIAVYILYRYFFGRSRR